jgi:hypothetical protein
MMNQVDLLRAVARATGESAERIARMGFSSIETPRRPNKMTRRLRRRKGRPQLAAASVHTSACPSADSIR